MARAKIFSYAVEGRRFTAFPMDMLRHAESFPQCSDDAGLIQSILERWADGPKPAKGENIRIHLSTHLDPCDYGFSRCAQRWESFGWKVLVRDADDEWGPYFIPGTYHPALGYPGAKHPKAAA